VPAGVVELGRHNGLKIRTEGDWQHLEKVVNPLIFCRHSLRCRAPTPALQLLQEAAAPRLLEGVGPRRWCGRERAGLLFPEAVCLWDVQKRFAGGICRIRPTCNAPSQTSRSRPPWSTYAPAPPLR
jgi:hypothetical protein